MHGRGLLVLALTTAALAGCTTATPGSGIQCTVWIGPTCPVERDPPEPGCEDRPLATKFVAEHAADGRVAAEFWSDEEGRFKVALEPGSYHVRWDAPNQGPQSCPPVGPVTVVAGHYASVEVHCDSGIR